MACPYEDHDIDVETIGRCVYCGKDLLNNVEAWTEAFGAIVYSPIASCDRCGEVHPT